MADVNGTGNKPGANYDYTEIMTRKKVQLQIGVEAGGTGNLKFGNPLTTGFNNIGNDYRTAPDGSPLFGLIQVKGLLGLNFNIKLSPRVDLFINPLAQFGWSSILTQKTGGIAGSPELGTVGLDLKLGARVRLGQRGIIDLGLFGFVNPEGRFGSSQTTITGLVGPGTSDYNMSRIFNLQAGAGACFGVYGGLIDICGKLNLFDQGMAFDVPVDTRYSKAPYSNIPTGTGSAESGSVQITFDLPRLLALTVGGGGKPRVKTQCSEVTSNGTMHDMSIEQAGQESFAGYKLYAKKLNDIKDPILKADTAALQKFDEEILKSRKNTTLINNVKELLKFVHANKSIDLEKETKLFIEGDESKGIFGLLPSSDALRNHRSELVAQLKTKRELLDGIKNPCLSFWADLPSLVPDLQPNQVTPTTAIPSKDKVMAWIQTYKLKLFEFYHNEPFSNNTQDLHTDLGKIVERYPSPVATTAEIEERLNDLKGLKGFRKICGPTEADVNRKIAEFREAINVLTHLGEGNIFVTENGTKANAEQARILNELLFNTDPEVVVRTSSVGTKARNGELAQARRVILKDLLTIFIGKARVEQLGIKGEASQVMVDTGGDIRSKIEREAYNRSGFLNLKKENVEKYLEGQKSRVLLGTGK